MTDKTQAFIELCNNDPVAAWLSQPCARGYLESGSCVPDHMAGGLARYIVKGIPPGDFLTCVLCNDLFGALGRADETNRHCLWDYAITLHNFTPPGCSGNPDRFNAWVKSGGIVGQMRDAEARAAE